MGGFPAGGRTDEQQIVKVTPKFGEESIREREGARLADIGIGPIPRTILRIEGVQVAGAAVQVEEDHGTGGAARGDSAGADLLGAEKGRSGGGSEKEVAAGEGQMAAAVGTGLIGHRHPLSN